MQLQEGEEKCIYVRTDRISGPGELVGLGEVAYTTSRILVSSDDIKKNAKKPFKKTILRSDTLLDELAISQKPEINRSNKYCSSVDLMKTPFIHPFSLIGVGGGWRAVRSRQLPLVRTNI